MKVPQDVLILDYQSVALPQIELDHVGVSFKECFPHSIEFIRELCAQDAEFEEALSPLCVVHTKAAQNAQESTDLLSKGLNDTIWRSLTLA